MVCVREVTPWEYRAMVRPLADDSMMTAPELNALGAEGWEVIGIVTPSHNTWYYFKRLATQAH